MGLEYKEIKCPNCGAPLQIKDALRGKVTVCEYCNAQIDLTKENGIKIGERKRKEYPSRLNVQLGTEATFGGKKYELIGRLVYEYDDEGDTDFWEEFLFLSYEGDYLWLECDVDGFMLYREFRPKRPVNPRELHEGKAVDFDGTAGTVKEMGIARVAFFEGELTWKVVLDSDVRYADIPLTTGETVSIEFSDKEIEFFRGQSMSRQAVYNALGIKYTPPKPNKSNIGFIIIVVIIIIVCCLFSMFGSSGGGPSVRTSSPSSSPSFSSSGGK